MKKYWLVFSLAGVMAAPQVFGTMSVTLYQDTGNYSFGVGGEFRAVGDAGLNSVVSWGSYAPSTALQNGYFQTFCTEQLETFAPGSLYSVTSIGNNALYNSGGPPGVPITLGVAYLYSQFAAGSLVGYNYAYGGGRTASAGDLQKAIWYLLGEPYDGATLAVWLQNDLQNVTGAGKVFATSADWTDAANGAFGVKDMVLSQPGQTQDQLVIVPEPTTMLAGALLLLPLGASTVRILRRNRMA